MADGNVWRHMPSDSSNAISHVRYQAIARTSVDLCDILNQNTIISSQENESEKVVG